jgi:outer membrane protein assembly factor BamD
VTTAGRRWHTGLWIAAALVAATGCRRGFEVRDFANPEALFRGALQEFEQGKMGNAILGFERLTLDLSTRDALLAPTYYYLAMAHERREEFLLAAQAYARLSDGFPSDSLAPKAMLGEGRSYQKLWRKPELDADYGLKAISTLRVLLTAYPDGPEAAEATERIATMEDWLARKDYEVGMHYMRTRKAYDSAIIYFQDVVETYPGTPTARLSWLAMLQAYRARKWTEEAQETCNELRRRYPSDAEVREACGTGPGADSLATLPAPPPA